MNYLAHLFLSADEDQLVIGNLMGDFVKGNRFEHLPQKVVQGIYQHRAIDKFTDSHAAVTDLKHYLSPERKRFSGIIADVAFDHFLAKHFSRFSELSLQEFTDKKHQQLAEHLQMMPQNMQDVVTRMVSGRWLENYQQMQSIDSALNGIANRIRFDNKLHGAGDEVYEHYQHFEQAFLQFFPQLKDFADKF